MHPSGCVIDCISKAFFRESFNLEGVWEEGRFELQVCPVEVFFFGGFESVYSNVVRKGLLGFYTGFCIRVLGKPL